MLDDQSLTNGSWGDLGLSESSWFDMINAAEGSELEALYNRLLEEIANDMDIKSSMVHANLWVELHPSLGEKRQAYKKKFTTPEHAYAALRNHCCNAINLNTYKCKKRNQPLSSRKADMSKAVDIVDSEAEQQKKAEEYSLQYIDDRFELLTYFMLATPQLNAQLVATYYYHLFSNIESLNCVPTQEQVAKDLGLEQYIVSRVLAKLRQMRHW